jgi:aspartate/methionine/tyrosine aminotransferase
MQQNFLISANSFVQRAGIAALSKEGDEAVERMRQVYDKRRKLMVELMREVGFTLSEVGFMKGAAFAGCS